MKNLKRTPIYPAYKEYGAKLVDFGGWELPVQFSGIKREHITTRTKAGLFDVSHMGEIAVTGNSSLPFLQKMLTNDVSKLFPGKAQYTFLCNEIGGTIDDLLVYMLEKDTYLLVVNAANTVKDVSWLTKHKFDDVRIENLSDHYAQLAIQGPYAEKILQKLTNTDLSNIDFFHFKQEVTIHGFTEKAIVSRTGYTGEDGFEIYIASQAGQLLWKKLLLAGKEEGLEPAGLGARDTLRFEACLPLYGQELNADISPLEVGMGFAVKLNKEKDFIGKQALREQKETGLKRNLIGLEMIDKGIPRHGYPVFLNGKKIGFITTGTQSPMLNKNIGLALLDTEYTEIDQELMVEIRAKKLAAKVIEIPFYKNKN